MWLSCVLGVVWLSVRLSERVDGRVCSWLSVWTVRLCVCFGVGRLVGRVDRPGGWWLVGLRATVRVWLRVLLAGVGLSVWLIVRLSARVAAE